MTSRALLPVSRTFQSGIPMQLIGTGWLELSETVYGRSRSDCRPLTLRNDDEGNHEVYGKDVKSKEILTSDMAPPAEAQPLITALNRYSKVEGHDSADRAKPDK